MITQRSTYQAENWTSNTKKPHQVIPQSYFRYEPISPSYDPNEFVKNYNKKSHQKFRQLRPAKKRPYQWIFGFSLRDWQELDEILPTIATKNQKFEENLRKKIHLKNRKIRSTLQFFDGLIWRQWSFWHLYVEGYMVRLTQRSTTAEVPTICAPISTSSLLIFSYFSNKKPKQHFKSFIFFIFFQIKNQTNPSNPSKIRTCPLT